MFFKKLYITHVYIELLSPFHFLVEMLIALSLVYLSVKKY